MAYIEERKTGDGQTRYRVLIRLKGHPVQSATFERKTDAKRWVQQTEAAIRDGRHFKTTEAKRHTLAELIDRYTRDVLPNKPKSADKQEQQLEWWKDQLGSYLLADITPALIAEHRDKLAAGKTKRSDRRSPATVIRYLAALSHAFTIAVKEWGWIEGNPVLKVTKPKEPRGRVRFLSDDEVVNGTVIEGERTRLLKACSASPCPYLYPVVLLALSTGMRSGEIMTLTWDDNVDLQRKRITLHETKNNERRVVPLVGRALDVLREHAKVRRLDTNLLFPSDKADKASKTYKPIDLRAPWTAALKAASVENFRFHDLRHTAASYLAMNGASVAEIAEVLGHKTLQMVKRYAHLSEPHTAKVVERMNEKIFG